jgi:hypothetical protein
VMEIRNAEIARLLDYPVEWTHARLDRETDNYEDTHANEGKGVVIRCSGCGLHGFRNELHLGGSCPSPAMPDFSEHPSIWVALFIENKLAIEPYRNGWIIRRPPEGLEIVGETPARATLLWCMHVGYGNFKHPEWTR